MADYQTKQKHRDMIVGIFVIVALCVFLWMLFRFRDLPLFVSKVKSFSVLVYFPEAPGVQKDTPVKYCGYQIGRVMKVARPQVRGESHKVGVSIAIDNEYSDIPDDAQFVVIKRGLGSSYIEIQDLSELEPTGFMKNEMVVENGTVGMANDFFPPEVQDKLEALVDSIAALSENANAIIGDNENQMNIKKLLANMESAFSRADQTLQSIQHLSDTSAENVEQVSNKIILATEQLEGTLSEFHQILAKVESGDGTAGKMINDGRLYEDLLESSQELRTLLQQLQEWVAESREEGFRIKL